MQGLSYIIAVGPVMMFFCACKKPSVREPVVEPDYELLPGVPAKQKKIDGYMFAGHDDYNHSYPRNYYWWRRVSFAMFSDPPENLSTGYNVRAMQKAPGALSANLSRGNVWFGNVLLYPESIDQSMSYQRNLLETFSVTPQDSLVQWVSSGTEHMPSFSFSFANPFPKIACDSGMVLPVSRSKGFKVPVGRMVANYDSVMVVNNDGFSFGKGAGKGTDTLELTSKDLNDWLGPNFYLHTIRLQGLKFYHARSAGRTYRFVFSASLRIPVVIQP